jgi:hypothetical protein
MSTRLSLPLFAPLADWAETPVWFASTEVCRRLGLTARQLQWWDEQDLLPARHEGISACMAGATPYWLVSLGPSGTPAWAKPASKLPCRR